MSTDFAKWQNKQVAAMLSIGINPLDAQRVVREFLRLLPPGADPDHYVIPARDMEQDVSDPKYATDALAAFVANEDVPNSLKLILTAQSAD